MTLTNKQLIDIAPSIGATKPFKNVSDRYSFIPTIKAVNFLRDDNWQPIMAGESRCNDKEKEGFQKHMIRFTKQDFVVGKERMDLLLYNSHNKAAAFKLIAGIFSFVCSNGLVVSDKMAEFSHRHIGFSPNSFIDSAKIISDRMFEIAKVIDDWKTIEMSPDEKGVFAYAAHGLMYGDQEPKNVPIIPEQLLTARRWEDKKNGDKLWNTYNIIQENMIKGGIKGNKNGKKRKTRGIKQIDKDRKLNQALWILTKKMAELKR